MKNPNPTKIEIYPVSPQSRLGQIQRAPRQLYVYGDGGLLESKSIAIVGTRRPSGYGLGAAVQFGRKLSESHLCIVSGLARGIDGAAHRGALAGGGKTIAVLGHGLDRIYPPQHLELARLIVEGGGCLVSEYPPGTPPLKHHFPARNRIIAGLSMGTLVIEAAKKSGSLITAQFSVDNGREVYVIPGRYDDEGFAGSHDLLQQGATLVHRSEDILSDLGLLVEEVTTRINDSPLQRWMGPELASLSDIFCRSGRHLAEVMSLIEEAIKLGRVVDVGGAQYLWTGECPDSDRKTI